MKKGMPEVPPSKNEIIDNIVESVDNKRFDAEAAATEVLKTGDPITFILDVFNQIHIGDRRIAELLVSSVGSTCVSNCAGIHPKLSGGSGKGKSHAGKTMLHLIPKGFWVNTSLSGKALYYNPVKEGTIVFSDDIAISDDLESLLRRATADFQHSIEHRTVDNTRTGKILRIPARIVWWLASVEDEFDIQTLNRQVGTGVDDSSETDRLVLEQQLMYAEIGTSDFPENDAVATARMIFNDIKKLFVRVVIPFARRIEWRGWDNRRNLPMFLDMIKVRTLFNYKQRETIESQEDSSYMIIATEEDFEQAAKLYQDRAETQSTKLIANELKIIDYLALGPADVSTIASGIDIPYHTVRRLLVGSKNGNGGMLGKVTGLSTEDVTYRTDGGNRRVIEYSLTGFDRLSSYGNIVSLKPE